VIKHRNMAIRFHCKLKVARGLQTFKYLWTATTTSNSADEIVVTSLKYHRTLHKMSSL
jgi:hypothetical protein